MSGRGRWSPLTLSLAVAIGAVAAIAAVRLLEGPWQAWRERQWRPILVAAALGVDDDARGEAWSRILVELETDTAFGGDLLASIDDRLATPEAVSDDALVDAARRLDRIGLWRWSDRPESAIRRSIESTAAIPGDRLALARLLDRPDPLVLPVGEGVVASIWSGASASDRSALLASLARCAEPTRTRTLGRLAEPEDPVASRRLSLLRDTDRARPRPEVDPAVSWELASDPQASPTLRRLALLRLLRSGGSDEVPAGVAAAIERLPVGGASGGALTAALLAEAIASDAGSIGPGRRAVDWLESVDPHRRSAGILLSTLLGRDDVERLARLSAARRDEDDRRVATLAAVAIVLDGSATPSPIGDLDPREFLHRVSHRDGRPDPDVLALRLARGDDRAVDALLEHGVDGDLTTDRTLEFALLERFCPPLAERYSGDRDANLVAWWRMLGDRRVVFDPDDRRWRPTTPERPRL